jgi:hypothetical protein
MDYHACEQENALITRAFALNMKEENAAIRAATSTRPRSRLYQTAGRFRGMRAASTE